MKITPESYFIFSGGEVHCKMGGGDQSHITCLDYTMNGFMALAELRQMLDAKGYPAEVTYPYLPYARQDRWMAENEPFSLKVFCQLLNSLKFNRVTIWDPHSDVAPALIDNCRVVPQWEIAKRVIPQEYFDDPQVLFVSPDAGAYKKLSKLIGADSRIVIGTKNRDVQGKITHTNVFYAGLNKLQGSTCVIVDDICDGGRTFIELAKALRMHGVFRVILYVTHGIFSNGFEELSKPIDQIYTTNSFRKQTGLPRLDYVKQVQLC
jgi:ribose-phosphate pyrophosphokinase